MREGGNPESSIAMFWDNTKLIIFVWWSSSAGNAVQYGRCKRLYLYLRVSTFVNQPEWGLGSVYPLGEIKGGGGTGRRVLQQAVRLWSHNLPLPDELSMENSTEIVTAQAIIWIILPFFGVAAVKTHTCWCFSAKIKRCKLKIGKTVQIITC